MRVEIMAAAIALAFSLVASGEEPAARSFHLYYGNSPEELAKLTARLRPGAIVVIDTRVLEGKALKQLCEGAAASGAKILGYLSIGEVHADEADQLREFLARENESTTLESITIDRNETFNSHRIDVLADPLRSWIRKSAETILGQGVDGLFLDTVDTVDTYITREEWDFPRRVKSVSAMISLIGRLKADHPGAYILQNGGLNLIGHVIQIDRGIMIPGQTLEKEKTFHPDGLLWENAFAGTDAWSRGRLEELRRIRKAGHVEVFALAYQESLGNPEAFFARCRKDGFIAAWAKSSEVLHKAVTVSNPDPP